jgi:hypothetical protein
LTLVDGSEHGTSLRGEFDQLGAAIGGVWPVGDQALAFEHVGHPLDALPGVPHLGRHGGDCPGLEGPAEHVPPRRALSQRARNVLARLIDQPVDVENCQDELAPRILGSALIVHSRQHGSFDSMLSNGVVRPAGLHRHRA